MERWLNSEIQSVVVDLYGVRVLNPYSACGHCSSVEKQKRLAFRTRKAERKVRVIVAKVRELLETGASNSDYSRRQQLRHGAFDRLLKGIPAGLEVMFQHHLSRFVTGDPLHQFQRDAGR